MKSKSLTILLAGLVTVLGVGCASTAPTPADKMISQAEDTKALGEQWRKGNKLVAKGEKIKAEGNDIKAEGDKKVQEGERLISEGKAMMEESELLFKKRFPGQSLELYKQE